MILTVKVVPRASKPGIAVEPDGSLKVRLHSPPVDGAANAELIDVLADACGVPRRAVSITGGAHSRVKRVHVEGIDESRLTAILSATSADARPPRQPRRRPRR